MIYGAIDPNDHSQLIIFHGPLAEKWYINDVQYPVLAPLMQQHKQGNVSIFQQDNTCTH